MKLLACVGNADVIMKTLAVAAILLCLGCSEKVQPAKPFVQSRAELTQIYEFERKECEAAADVFLATRSRVAEALWLKPNDLNNLPDTASFADLENMVASMPKQKSDLVLVRISDQRKTLQPQWDGNLSAAKEAAKRMNQAKADLDAVRP